jgi:hypothetical protein
MLQNYLKVILPDLARKKFFAFGFKEIRITKVLSASVTSFTVRLS